MTTEKFMMLNGKIIIFIVLSHINAITHARKTRSL